MEKMNKKMVFGFIIVMLLFISVCTVIKVYNKHIDAKYIVVEKKINESAEKCLIDKICSIDKTITLGFLISSGYLDKQINPVSKEYISDDTIVKCKDYECSVNIRD